MATDGFVIDQVIDTTALNANILGYDEIAGVQSTLEVHPPYQRRATRYSENNNIILPQNIKPHIFLNKNSNQNTN